MTEFLGKHTPEKAPAARRTPPGPHLGPGPFGGPIRARAHLGPGPFGPGPIGVRAHLGPGPFAPVVGTDLPYYGHRFLKEKIKTMRRRTKIELRTHLIMQNTQNSTANTMGLVPEPKTTKKNMKKDNIEYLNIE